MFKLVLYSNKTISNACTAVFNAYKSLWTIMSKGTKIYTVDRLELVLFSINIISKSRNVVFNVSKVRYISCLKVLRHLTITSNSWFSDLTWHLPLFYYGASFGDDSDEK